MPSNKEEPHKKVEEAVEEATSQISEVFALPEVEAGSPKDDWNAREDEGEKVNASGIKDTWDASSDKEVPELTRLIDKGNS